MYRATQTHFHPTDAEYPTRKRRVLVFAKKPADGEQHQGRSPVVAPLSRWKEVPRSDVQDFVNMIQ